MQNCHDCGAPVADDADVCSACGADLGDGNPGADTAAGQRTGERTDRSPGDDRGDGSSEQRRGRGNRSGDDDSARRNPSGGRDRSGDRGQATGQPGRDGQRDRQGRNQPGGQQGQPGGQQGQPGGQQGQPAGQQGQPGGREQPAGQQGQPGGREQPAGGGRAGGPGVGERLSGALGGLTGGRSLGPVKMAAFPVSALLFLGAWAYLAAWLGNVSNAGLLYLSAFFWLASVGAMYLDLRWLGDELAGRSPGTWAVGGLLMYPGVMLIYFVDRLRHLAG